MTGHVHDHADHGHRHDHADRGHLHDHAGRGHAHHHRPASDSPAIRRALLLAIVLTGIVFAAELIGGLAFRSLALLSDAAHMLTDVAAYALALFAWWLARRPATTRRTYGFARAEILVALVNGATLIAASGWIVYEAVHRLARPEHVHGGGVIAVALVGLVCNALAMVFLSRADSGNLNIRAATLHTLADAASSGGVVVAGIAIALTGIDRIDPAISFAIAGLVILGSWRLVRESVDVLLDAAPRGVDSDAVATAMLECDGVSEVHDLHVWSLGSGMAALSAHVRTLPGITTESAITALETLLRDRFHIDHTTLQLTTDRSQETLDAIGMLPLAEAIEWANEHIVRTYPNLSRASVAAATGAAAVHFDSSSPVSPVTLSIRALNGLGLAPSPPDR